MRFFLMLTVIVLGGCLCTTPNNMEKINMTKEVNQNIEQNKMYYSIKDFGAVGDGITDDTDAIQAGINFVYAKGSGTLFFPYTKNGYRIAKPAPEQIDGKPCRSQLYIPSFTENPMESRNICLEGEMPVAQGHRYQLVMGGRWASTNAAGFPMAIANVCLISNWEAPEEPDRNARPWALISVLGGHKLPFGLANLTVKNLEFRVFLNTDKMYPTSSAANFMSTSRLIIEHSYFGLDKNIGCVNSNKELLANPCYTAGVITSADQNDHQRLDSVGVQGFRYGFVLGEHIGANYLYVHNCEEGIVFHDSSHLSVLNYVVAQHNRIIVSALREPTFAGLYPSKNIYVQINGLNYETGTNTRPVVCQTQFVVFDPDNRITGQITYHSGWPVSANNFSITGGKRIRAVKFGDWIENLTDVNAEKSTVTGNSN